MSGLKYKFVWGCLAAPAVLILLIIAAALGLSEYSYREDNARRPDPMENLARFHRELKRYQSEHEGRCPPRPGVDGLSELTVLLSDLRVKDDRSADTAYDHVFEASTSYAYVAAGLTGKELDATMPVIFEKPWNRARVRVLLGDGRIEIPERTGFKNCREVIVYFRERAKGSSPAWDALLRNAEHIDEYHGRK